MTIHEVQDQQFTVTLSRNELVILNNALNEICNGIDAPEFETRIGATMEDARLLLREVHRAIDRAR